MHTATDSQSSRVETNLAPTQHPNFDFDTYSTGPLATFDEEEEDNVAPQPVEEYAEEDLIEEDEVAEAVSAVEEQDAVMQRLHPSIRHSVTHLARPFLPFTCDACHLLPSSHPAPPTCAKYHARLDQSAAQNPSSPFDSHMLERSILYPGSGHEIRRVLKRAIKSSLYGAQRAREAAESGEFKYEDEEPFRIMVLGGSGECSRCARQDDELITLSIGQYRTVVELTKKRRAGTLECNAGSSKHFRWKASMI